MDAQIPAQGILQANDWGDSKSYRISCSCGSDDHNHDVFVDAEDTGVSVVIYTTVKTNYWSKAIEDDPYSAMDEDPWYANIDRFCRCSWNNFVRKIKLSWNIWVDGYVKYEADLTMTDQQALNYAETLKSAIEDTKQFRQERNERLANRPK